MKKKKFNWRFYIGFVFIALAIIGLIGLIVINQEPHFKITKEECSIGFLCVPVNCSGACGVSWFDRNVSEYIEELKCYEWETCEQVEVDELYLPWNLTFEGRRYVGDGLKLKKYITTDWLDGNCECIEGGIDDTTIPCKDLSCSNRKCLKYKCGEYFVEVER